MYPNDNLEWADTPSAQQTYAYLGSSSCPFCETTIGHPDGECPHKRDYPSEFTLQTDDDDSAFVRKIEGLSDD